MRKNLNDLGVTDFVNSDEEASGSSDIGNVSHVCPTVYCELDTGARPKVFAHHETFLKYVHGKMAPYTSYRHKALAATALDVFENPDIVK